MAVIKKYKMACAYPLISKMMILRLLEKWLCKMNEVEKITQLLNSLDNEQLDLVIEYIYKLKDLENIKARLDVESGNTESFSSVNEWWDNVTGLIMKC